MRIFEVTNKVSLEKVIELFKTEEAYEIEQGCERDECMVPASSFTWFAARYGYKVPKVHGSFKVDKPLFDKADFHDAELAQMKADGLNPNKKTDRIKFAKKYDMVDLLKVIPHYWNEYNGQIIDFTAQAQFVNTGLAADTSNSRYSKELPKSIF